MSTLDPDTRNELGRRVEDHGDVKLIAAAVCGGATGAQDGTLSIMASGPEERVASARPYFDAVGSNVFYYGSEPGSGDLPQDELLNLFKVSTGDSWVARNWDSVSD